MELTERLVEARKARGLSQADAAERLNVSRQAISRWETGVGSPSLDSLIQMSQLYGVSLNELVYGPETAQPREEMTAPEAQPECPAVREPHRRRTALLAADSSAGGGPGLCRRRHPGPGDLDRLRNRWRRRGH